MIRRGSYRPLKIATADVVICNTQLTETQPRAAAPRIQRAAWPALCAAVLIVSSAVAERDWVTLGPAPITSGPYTGRVAAIVCHPTDPGLYYVGGADGGVWRSADAGTTWTPLTDDMPSTAIGALAMDPADPAILYAGTGEANYANHSRFGVGIYKTVDGGNTWTQFAEETFGGRCFARLLVHPTDTQILFAAVTRAGGFPALAAAKGHPGANGPVGVFRSGDGGATWAQVGGGLPADVATDIAFDAANPDLMYAAIGDIFGGSNNGIYRSLDGGATWARLGGGLPASTVGRISLATAPSQPGRCYALITRPADAFGGGASTLGAYRTDNSGATWALLPALGNIQSSYGWYLSIVAVQPTNANTVFMGGLDFRRSTDSGATWSTVTPPHVDLHAAVWDAAGRLLIGDDGGLHRTATLGNTWTAHNAGLGLIQFYAGLSSHPTDAVTFFGGFQDNGSNRRTTASLNWTQVLGGDGGWTQLDQADPLRVFVEFQGSGNLYRSTNGGAGFSLSSSGISGGDRNAFMPPYVIDPTNSNRMLYATQRIYRSLNGGTNWTAISGDVSGGAGAIRALALAPSNPQVVYVATTDGFVKKSVDGGATFTTLLADASRWPRLTREITVAPYDADIVYLAGWRFDFPEVRRSTSGGATWETLDGDLPDLPVNVIEADHRFTPAVLYAGTEAGVYRSLDDGGHWRHFGDGLPSGVVVDLQLDAARDRLVAATQGRGLWSAGGLNPADLDGNGFIALADLAALLADYGCVSGDCEADLDGDGDVDLTDLSILLSAFGT